MRPRIEPCGTPQSRLAGGEVKLSILVFFYLKFKVMMSVPIPTVLASDIQDVKRQEQEQSNNTSICRPT